MEKDLAMQDWQTKQWIAREKDRDKWIKEMDLHHYPNEPYNEAASALIAQTAKILQAHIERRK